MLGAAAKRLKATVYGNQSFTPGYKDLFEDRLAYYTQEQLREHGANILTATYPETSPNAYKNTGKWTRITKDGKISTIHKPYFDSFGKFRYKK